jgi:hypothetical protein
MLRALLALDDERDAANAARGVNQLLLVKACVEETAREISKQKDLILSTRLVLI